MSPDFSAWTIASSFPKTVYTISSIVGIAEEVSLDGLHAQELAASPIP